MAAPTEREVTRIIVAVDRATRDCEYAESIKLDMQQITGTRYSFRISEHAES